MRVRDVRDGVLLADFPDASEESANKAARALAGRLRAARPRGLLDAVPAARSLLVVFDPLALDRGRVVRALDSGRARGLAEKEASRRLVVPVAYNGPDLEALARDAGLSPEDFARRHAGGDYRVAFLGFAPGFAYLTGLPAELTSARLREPRPRVPAGSVAIGGAYTGIYPQDSPGGWRLIGRTTVRLFDPDADPPSLLRAGDRVRFESVRPDSLRLPPPRERPRERGSAILRVISPGLATTVQGAAAYGLGSSGVPPGGAMDPRSLARANALVGNAPDAPGLEIAVRGAGPELEALEECVVAVGGAGVEADWNGEAAPGERGWILSSGDRLRIKKMRGGLWAYVAVGGGLLPSSRTPPQPRLAAGETVLGRGRAAATRVEQRAEPEPSSAISLRVMPGPEADHFDSGELSRLLSSPWTVSSESDRRGLRLRGPAPLVHSSANEIPPSGTVPGTIQVPGGGWPIVLGPDGPVTGGYPRIATVIGRDLELLGPAAPGTVLRFRAVSLAEALEARRSSGSTMRLP